MHFIVCGPFEPGRKPNKHIDSSKEAKRRFWDAAESKQKGIASASGCYLFALSTGGGIIPWYVGKAGRLSFEHEIFTPHKLN